MMVVVTPCIHGDTHYIGDMGYTGMHTMVMDTLRNGGIWVPSLVLPIHPIWGHMGSLWGDPK
jgi:hypothetical protein